MTATILDEQPTALSSLPARDISVSLNRGTMRLIEHHVVARTGLTLYDLSTDELADQAGSVVSRSCASDLGFIRQNLVLRH